MGLGKSKIVLDTASWLWTRRKIDAVLVLAPNSVYRNWVTSEIPTHLAAPHLGIRFETHDSTYRRTKLAMLLDPDLVRDKLRVLCMSYDALRTERGLAYARKFVKIFRTMIVADESSVIKNPRAVVTKRVMELRASCHYARACSGTPAAQSPQDVHSQVEFLDPDFWAEHGVKSASAFAARFGVFQQVYVAGGKRVDKCVGHRDLDVLERILKTISSRLLKEDSGVELPPKLYSTRSFKMEPRQRSVYDDLAEQFWTEFEANPGGFVDASLAITRLTRLQQVTSGFVTADVAEEPGDEELGGIVATRKALREVVAPADNPRLRLLLDIVEECGRKVIVWCRFRHSVDIVCDALGTDAVRYDGATSQVGRQEALARFRDPSGPRVFVANTAAISMGVTLNIAKTAVYYENDFRLERRLQSEDRCHRIGQDSPVHMIDLCAENSVDEKISDALRRKFDTAAMVTGDSLRDWIKRPTREEEDERD